jgi:hypothetical protein
MSHFALMILKIRVPYILKNFPEVFPFHFSKVVAKPNEHDWA